MHVNHIRADCTKILERSKAAHDPARVQYARLQIVPDRLLLERSSTKSENPYAMAGCSLRRRETQNHLFHPTDLQARYCMDYAERPRIA